MSEDHPFRASFFESVPPIVPLAVTFASVVMAFITFIGHADINDIPIQYASSALWISLAGLSFSFYVTQTFTEGPDLDSQQEDRQSKNERSRHDHSGRI